MAAREDFLAAESGEEIGGGSKGLFEIARGTTGDEVGGGVTTAEGDGEDVVEGPFAGAAFGFTSLGAAPFGFARDRRSKQGPPAIKAAVAVAVENARAEGLVAEMVGTRPSARLAGSVAVRLVRDQGELLGNGSASGAGGNLAGEKNFETAAARAAVENAKALLADEYAKIMPRGIRGKAQDSGQLAARDAHGAASGQTRAADQMVIERAFVRAEAKRGDEAVFDGDPEASGGGAGGHGKESQKSEIRSQKSVPRSRGNRTNPCAGTGGSGLYPQANHYKSIIAHWSGLLFAWGEVFCPLVTRSCGQAKGSAS